MGFFSSEGKIEKQSEHAETRKSGSSGSAKKDYTSSTKSQIKTAFEDTGLPSSKTVKETKKGIFDLFS